MKRLQEALRSLEEYGKVLHGGFAKLVEQFRYRTYTLEQALHRSGALVPRLAAARLYMLLTGAQCTASLDWTIAEAAAGGVAVFQLREKDLSDAALLERARRVRQWTRTAGALFIVNDRPDIAAAVAADGVHLGQDDLPVAVARRILGPDKLIGVSTHTPEQVQQAVQDGASYLGAGPVFPSQTKPFDTYPGIAFAAAATRTTSLPVFALGGISPSNLHELTAAGVLRIAVSAALATADDPQAVARTLLAQLPNATTA
jgi:thiamine-phosphate pyrophosphorylase